MSFVLLLSVLGSVLSAPTTLPNGREDRDPLVLFGRQVPNCMDPMGYRSTQDIVLSCLATVSACTWVAVHPNLDGPYDSRLTGYKRKVMTMVCAMVGPELMTLWALAQWSAARTIAEEFNKANKREETKSKPWYRAPIDWLLAPRCYPSKRWTLVHGFFIQMGGFILFKGDTPIRVLTFKDLQELIEKEMVDAPTIREDEIEDKSKGDFLTKLGVVLQTTWFVFQCFARWASHLPVTELEVVTLAFATVNVFTCALWWYKPQNAVVAVAVQLKESRKDEADTIDGEGGGEGGEEKTSLNDRGEKERWIRQNLREQIAKGWFGWLIGVPFVLIFGLLRPLFKMGRADKSEVQPASLRVPMFYVEKDDGNEGWLIMVIGPIFGALHLIPWSSQFPSTIECTLWRCSALIITIRPISALLLLATSMIIEQCNNWLSKLFGIVLVLASILGLPVFALARFTLLTLAFTTLRALPQDTHTTIEWITFVPHIG